MKYGNYKMISGQVRDSDKCSEFCIIDGETFKKKIMREEQMMEDRLWNYIDGNANTDEQQAIENLLAAQSEWKRKYQQLMEINQLLYATALDSPSMRFTVNVMEEIARHQVAPATKSYINKKVIWGIGIFFLTTIVGMLVYGFFQVTHGVSSPNSEINAYLDRVPKLDWNRFFSSAYTNIFMMVNIVLGLMLLDMYLQRRKEKATQPTP